MAVLDRLRPGWFPGLGTHAPAGTGGGHVAPGFEDVAGRFTAAIGTGRRGGALVVMRGDDVLLDVYAGWSDAAGTRRWTPDTTALSFSTTKGLAATVIHRLADRDLLAYDEPVAAYWPAFAAAGKQHVTVRQLLAHQAALHSIQALVKDPFEMLDHLEMERRLAAATPAWTPGRAPAYHAFTFGWLAAGLARAITGKGMAQLVREELCEPLQTSGLNIGRPADSATPVADVVGNSLAILERTTGIIERVFGNVKITRATREAFLIPGYGKLVHSPRVWDSETPAVNGALSARGLARLYAPLANGGAVNGRRLLSEQTVRDMGRVQTRQVDRALGVRMRWRLGYHQAHAIGARMPRAFGHYGFGGSGGWADPETGLSLGFVTNDTGSLTTPIGDLTLYRLSALVPRALEQHQALGAVA